MTYDPSQLNLQDTPGTKISPGLDIIRVPAAGHMGGILCDHTPAMVYTHWHGGRTVPCTKECTPCDEGSPRRWHAYAQLYSPSSHRLCVIEMTDACRGVIYRYLENEKTTRGAQISLTRRGSQRNGKLSLSITKAKETIDLPPEIDLLQWLCELWGAADRTRKSIEHTDHDYSATISRCRNGEPKK